MINFVNFFCDKFNFTLLLSLVQCKNIGSSPQGPEYLSLHVKQKEGEKI